MAKETKGVWNLEYRNLHAAAKMDWDDIVQKLIDEDHDVDGRITKFGMTPLYFAFTNCSTKSAIILIENGADPWLEVKNRPIYEYWGKKAKNQIEMDPKLKDYIEQLKPETFEFESSSDEE